MHTSAAGTETPGELDTEPTRGDDVGHKGKDGRYVDATWMVGIPSFRIGSISSWSIYQQAMFDSKEWKHIHHMKSKWNPGRRTSVLELIV